MNLDQTVLPSPDVLSQEVAGETVLLDLNSEHYFGLDAVGTRIWQLIQQGLSLRAIVDTMLAEYEVDEAQLIGDLEALLSHAREHGLLSLAGTP